MATAQTSDLLDTLTEAEARKLVGFDLDKWDGNCHAASCGLAERLGGVVRRGYFTGETTPGAPLHDRPCQHSWIELPDGRVCDPTRHAFTLAPRWPLWVGPDDEYDIGGCKLAAPAGDPPDLFETEREMVELELGSIDYVAGLLGTSGEFFGEDWITVSTEQAWWLANLPVKDREGAGVLSRFFAAEVYEALGRAGFAALIPIDRKNWILGEDA